MFEAMLPNLISGGAGLLGTVLSNNASSAQAARQMEFQAQQSGTAHQREVADLRAANLNPILSAGGPGAAAGPGASGNVDNFAEGISGGINTAIASKAQAKLAETQDAGISNTEADTSNKKAQSSLIQNQSAATAQEIRQKSLQNQVLEKTLPAMIKKANAEGDYSEVNQIMGIINSGASSAGSILGIGNGMKQLINSLPTKGKKP